MLCVVASGENMVSAFQHECQCALLDDRLTESAAQAGSWTSSKEKIIVDLGGTRWMRLSPGKYINFGLGALGR